ncbi:protein-export membrane protein SecF [Spirochaetia bacterium]|nr:protein-export membrane protein SecF [Spirochaetia bacterium]
MKNSIQFSKYFLPTAIASAVILVAGLVGYVVLGGFELGVDFQPGLIAEVQFAPVAARLTYTGRGNAQVSMVAGRLDIVVSGSGVESFTRSFPYSNYPTIGVLKEALSGIEGIQFASAIPETTEYRNFIQDTQENPELGTDPYELHYLPPDSPAIPIDAVRDALAPLGQLGVQLLGAPSERHFLIRMEEDPNKTSTDRGLAGQVIVNALSDSGNGALVVTRSDYVGSRFSEDLTRQAALLLLWTLGLILLYAWFRFKLQYAIGAILAIIHDGLIMVVFVAITRLEFNTTIIAAILTILGYSINDTIVIFDRIRETRRIYPQDSFVAVLNRAITETLGRTVITTVTTMLAVVSLFIFTTGSMKDFALVLLVGMISGVYSTIFIASGFVNFWDIKKTQAEKKKLLGTKYAVKA